MLLSKLRGLYVLITSAVLICSIQAKVFVVEKGIGTKSSAQADSYLNKEGNAWTLNIDIKSFEGNKEKRLPLRSSYYKFEVPGFKLSQKPGQPQLPYQSFLVKGQPSDIEVNVVAEGEKDFENILTMPAPLKSCRCLKDLSFGTESFPLKRESYFQGQDKVVELKYLGDYRGQHITKVIVRPMLQQGNKLKVYKGLEITLESNSSLEVEEFVAQADTMVIVTPQKLLSGAQEFKTFKEETGMSVELFVYEDVARDAATLKTFFHNKYRRDAYQYAVLFGHEEILPSLRVATSSDPQTPSDYPYFVMGGSGDVFPDVFYSRVVANTNREVQNQIKKLREYRDQTWDNAQGVKTAIGIASNEGWDPNDVEYVGQMIDPLVRTIGFNKTDFFQDNANSNPRDINRALNKGARWLNYIGHGIGDSWPSITDGQYHSDDIKKLRPGVVKPVIIDVACQNGKFTYNENKLGERFMNASYLGKPTGAVAYYGGSVDISWDPPAIMAVAIGEHLAQQQIPTLFELIMKGQRHLIENYEDSEAAKENLRWYHLFGDPSMRVDSL